MNEMIIGCAVLVAVALFIYNSFYGGAYRSIASASVGDVFHMEYLQPLNGETHRYFVKVIEPVHSISDDSIRYLNATSKYRSNDKTFVRTNHIVTCLTRDGIRQFYCERVKNCKKPFLGKLLFKNA